MGNDSEIEQRRQRLQALRAKREALSATVGASSTGARQQVSRDRSGGGGMKAAGPAKQMLAKLLLKTLEGGIAGQVRPLPGRTYSEQGVTRLIAILRKRAQDQATPGAEVAKRLLQTVTQPGSDPQAMVAGINLAQLDKLVAFARRSLNREGGATAATGQIAAQPEANGESISEMRATIRQLTSTVETLTRQLQQLNQGQGGAPLGDNHGVATDRRSDEPHREASNRLSTSSSDGSDWVDDFVEDR